MKILYFYQYFSTPKGSWGTRVYEFTRIWVEQGHDVTVVTGVYSKSDILASKLLETQYIDGVKVKVVNVKIDNKQKAFKRIWTWFEYLFFSSWYALVLPADVVIASSGPITVGIPGLVARYVRKRKFVFEARDIWPQTAIEMGMLKNKHLQRLSYWFEKKCYKASSHVITLSPGMVNDIISRYPETQVTSIPNSANIDLFSNISSYDINDWHYRKYAIYTGNIGIVNNSEWLFNAAMELKKRGRKDIYILLIGDGPLKEVLVNKAEQMKIDNFIVLNLIPKTNLVAYLQNAMASLVPLKFHPILSTSSPNKFFEAIAAGVPVIQNTNGWMRDFLEKHEIGFTIESDDYSSLADILIQIADNEIDISKIRGTAKAIAKKEFDKDFLADKMLRILISMLKK